VVDDGGRRLGGQVAEQHLALQALGDRDQARRREVRP
jgi:hypothetical protein